QKIFKDARVETVEELLQLKRSIVNIRSAMQPHKYVIRKLIDASPQFLSSPKLPIYYANLVDHTKEIWDALENNKEAITALYETNMALYSLRLNGVMRAYTTVSVVIFAMSLVATLFAVHALGTPFLDLPMAFWIILLIELGVAATMYVFFKLKKWT
ncbi:MAG: CorA family divalent cation transporter, partial [bacterium]|nr:CorA family divalent cation transporter [bacterium]